MKWTMIAAMLLCSSVAFGQAATTVKGPTEITVGGIPVSTGNPFPSSSVVAGGVISANNPQPSMDHFTNVALGNVTGESIVVVPGRKESLSTTVLDDLTEVAGTTVLPDPGGIQLEIVSGDVDDDGDPVGDGCRTVRVHYLDTSGMEQSEIITLNGQTPVNTVATDIDVVQWMHSNTVGSSGICEGEVTLRNTGDTIDFEVIAAGGNQSLGGHFQVPTGMTGYILGWHVSAIAKEVDFRLRATVARDDRTLLSGVFLFQDAAVVNNTSTGWISFPIPLRVPAGAKVKISGKSTGAGGDGGGAFQMWLVTD